MNRILPPHRRGDTFEYSFTLGNSWQGGDFARVLWTLRTSIPAPTVLDDTDAVDTAGTDTGEITFVGAVGTILIPASRTKTWATGQLYWDLQGVIDGPTQRVFTIDPPDGGQGTIHIYGDITRRTDSPA
jgi:hypothetical protein